MTQNLSTTPINGILLVNKPIGMTSNAVLQYVKRLYNAEKAGHTGSLDPMATGMLPICFGEATKWCQYLLDADKSYVTTGCLGIKTNTGDATGEVIATNTVPHISSEYLLQVLASFQGKIQQIPSMFSALKHNGMPLYKFARSGLKVERAARTIIIYALQLLEFDGINFKLMATCSKGTYIRSLVEDIGDYLNVGAHVVQLHRSYTAGFEQQPMFTLETLSQASMQQLLTYLLPMETALLAFTEKILTHADLLCLRQGKTLICNTESIGYVRLYDAEMRFVGLGEITSDGILKAKRLLKF